MPKARAVRQLKTYSKSFLESLAEFGLGFHLLLMEIILGFSHRKMEKVLSFPHLFLTNGCLCQAHLLS